MNDPAIFTGFGAIEAAGFQSDFFMRDANGENFVCDMCGVLPMMRYWRLREFHRGSAVRECYRAQRWIADGSEVNIGGGVFTKLMGVMEPETHDEIVRMLRIDQRLPVGGLSGLKQQRVALAGDGRGIQAEHQV